MFRDRTFVITTKGWAIELREDQTFADLHAALSALLGWPPEEEYTFAFAGGRAPKLEDPEEIVSGADAAIIPLWCDLGPLGRRFWHVGGARGERRTRLEVDNQQRAYARLAYPRVVRAPKGKAAPPLAGDQSEGAAALREAARVWSQRLEEVAAVLREGAERGRVHARALNEVVAGLTEFFAWCGNSRDRFDCVTGRIDDDLPTLAAGVLFPELARAGRFQDGLVVADGLVRLDPAPCWLSTATAMLHGDGREDEAVAKYTEILRQFPGCDIARLHTADVLRSEGKIDDAERILRGVIDDPDDDAVQHQAVAKLAEILEQRGEAEEAARVRQRRAFTGRADAVGADPWRAAPAPARALPPVGRNDPCPCGSGRKFKKCCGAPTAPSGPDQIALPRVAAAVAAFAERAEVDQARRAAVAEWLGSESADLRLGDIVELPLDPCAAMAALEGILFDARGADGRTLADRFAESPATRLDDVERRVLDRLRASSLSLYQLVAVEPGAGFEALDLLRGGRVLVRERTGSRQLKRWDVLALRPIELDGVIQICGGLLPYPVMEKDRLLKRLQMALDEFRVLFPGSDIGEALKAVGDEFLAAALARRPSVPQLATTDGEPLLLSKAHFRLDDAAAAARALAAPPFEELEPGREFGWTEPRAGALESVSLGRISVSGGRLTLECLSRERLERGKALLRAALGPGLHHVGDEFTDPGRLLAEAAQAPPARKGPSEQEQIPAEVAARIEREFQDRHYHAWVDEPVPALDGATPRAAAATPLGRRRIADLLRQFENTEERGARPGRPPYDFGWLWQELGIGREEGL